MLNAVCTNSLKLLIRQTLLEPSNILSQQARSVIIVKRRNPPFLHKKGSKPRLLKAKHHLYDVVLNTDTVPKVPIEIILTADVANLGRAGDKVAVKPYRAYYTLLLPKLAVYATPENIEKYCNKVEVKQDLYSSLEAKETMKNLSELNLIVSMSSSTSWTIQKWHIRTSFRKAGISVPNEVITLPDKEICGPDMSINLKQFYVTVTINNREKVHIRCTLWHWTDKEDNDMTEEEFSKLASEPIFPEHREILDSFPTPIIHKGK